MVQNNGPSRNKCSAPPPATSPAPRDRFEWQSCWARLSGDRLLAGNISTLQPYPRQSACQHQNLKLRLPKRKTKIPEPFSVSTLNFQSTARSFHTGSRLVRPLVTHPDQILSPRQSVSRETPYCQSANCHTR